MDFRLTVQFQNQSLRRVSACEILNRWANLKLTPWANSLAHTPLGSPYAEPSSRHQPPPLKHFPFTNNNAQTDDQGLCVFSIRSFTHKNP